MVTSGSPPGESGQDALLLDRWEGCTSAELRSIWGVPAVYLFAAVGSTNDIARRLGEQGAATGTLVLAEEQRAGRGRGGKSWSSPRGLGLWLSLIHRPPTGAWIGQLPLRIAIGTAAALDHWCEPKPVGVKWPNDLILDGKKVGGILCEGTWEKGELRHMVIGIGLNLLQGRDDFPPQIRERATSLRAATGQPISRFDVATELLDRLQPVLRAQSSEALPADLAGRDVLRGREVQIRGAEDARTIATGVAAGVAPDGALVLTTREGAVEVRSGTVHIVGGIG
ncbi:MAG: biotin--[acetyl-CoA-carboxylase] ligase [Gemmatimonas sp.]|nr:biotin--[acetyl-CoA-carboxylase] ligase [Gemmatimonas sp.]